MSDEQQDNPQEEPEKEEKPQKEGELKGDEVSSIFNKDAPKKEPSSLFEHYPKTPPPTTPAAPAGASFVPTPSAIKRRAVNGRHKKSLPIGVDIGFTSVKVAQLALVGNEVVADKIILAEYPQDVYIDSVQKQQRIKQFLSNLCGKYDLKGEAFSALETNDVEFKNITLPKMPVSEIKSALGWELKRIYGDRLKDYSYDYITLGQNKVVQYERIEVLLVITKRQSVMDHLDLFEETDLKVTAVEAEPLSLLANLDHNHKVSPSEVVMLLDLGGGATRLNIIKNCELHFTRILNINGNSLTNAIKEYCQVSFKEAEDYKRTFGQPQPSGSEISPNNLSQALQIRNAITLLLEKLVSDIDHTFKYYSYQLTKSEVKNYHKIILSGGASNFQMIIPFLKDRLEVPVEVDQPLASTPVSESTARDFNLEKEAVRFGIALGLALRGVEAHSQ